MNNHFMLTLVTIFLFLLLRALLLWWVRYRYDLFVDNQRRWNSHIKNYTTMIMVFSLFLIWMSELQDFIFSIAAFFVAIVIALKEFLLCLVGSLYQATTRPFSVGDWIQVNGYTGEVVDRDWVSTTLLDIDVENGTFDFTGKTLELPNSLFLSHVVKKLHFMRRYVVHRFSIYRPAEVNLCTLRPLVLKSARRACAHFRDVAERYQNLIQKRLGIDLPGPDPEVRISTTDVGINVMTISLFCPVDEALAIEQVVTETLMAAWYAKFNQQRTA
jgi:small-conductance mechanosensitive channel